MDTPKQKLKVKTRLLSRYLKCMNPSAITSSSNKKNLKLLSKEHLTDYRTSLNRVHVTSPKQLLRAQYTGEPQEFIISRISSTRNSLVCANIFQNSLLNLKSSNDIPDFLIFGLRHMLSQNFRFLLAQINYLSFFSIQNRTNKTIITLKATTY